MKKQRFFIAFDISPRRVFDILPRIAYIFFAVNVMKYIFSPRYRYS